MSYNSVSVRPSTNGSHPDVAVDRVAGVDLQRIKPSWGPEGTANEVADTDALRLPVGGKKINNIAKAIAAVDMGEAASGGAGNGAVTGAAAGLRLAGISVRETTGAATARVTLRNGDDAADARTVEIVVGDGESTREMFPKGVVSDAGIFLVRESGTTSVLVYHFTEES